MDNQRSDRPERRTAFVARELRRLNIDIAALQETRLADEGQLTEVGGGYTFYWKGKDATDHRLYGVGFAVKNELVKDMDNLPVGISERLMTLQINIGKNRKATLVSAYAPTLMADQEDKEQFYSALDDAVLQIPAADKVVVLGDFNARVGTDSETWKDVIGKDGVGKVNANGLMLLTKCAELGLVITNTLFRQNNRRKTSWRHPRSGHWHLIDYIITRRRDIADVRITKAINSSDCCWTDHRLVKTLLTFSIQPQHRRIKRTPRPRFNVNLLQQPAVRQEFQEKINEKLSEIPEDSNVSSTWESLKSSISATCKEVLGNSKRHHQDWFDENDKEIDLLMTQKRAKFGAWQDDFQNKTKRKAYHSIRADVQRRVRKMQNDWWIAKSKEIQSLADQNKTREFFAETRKLYGPVTRGSAPVQDKDGVLQKEKDDIRQCWKVHFSCLLNQTSSVDDTALQKLPQLQYRNQLSNEPSLQELKSAIKAMKCGKAAGADGIPAEVFKHGGPTLSKKLHRLFTLIWTTESIPDDLRDALIVTIFKKGDKTVCGNYRGISLLSIAGKILARILSQRLSHAAEDILPESQCGFRPGRGTVDMIFAARQIQEKCREQHQDLYMAFIDLTKAFDTVDRKSLWNILGKIGCPPKFVTMVRLLHEEMSASVLVDGQQSESFKVQTGVKQGCVIAPTLFSIYLFAVLYLVKQELPSGIGLNYRIGDLFNLQRLRAKTLTSKTSVLELQYADDNALVADSEEHLQAAMTAFEKAYNALGLKLNARKTQVVCQPRPGKHIDPPSITAGGEELCSVDDFVYLGSSLSVKADLSREIDRRLQAAGIAFSRLRQRVFDNSDIQTNTKLKVYKAIIVPTLLYASETWATYSTDIKKLEDYHMRKLRQLLKIKWTDKRTNNSVYQETKIPSLESLVVKNRLRWAGHLVRMDNNRLPKQILYGELQDGKRSQGGQRKRYKDCLKDSMKRCHIRTETWEWNATRRTRWRSMIHKGVQIFEDERLRHREELRAGRKARLNSANTQMNDDFRCQDCDRACSSWIGLRSHQKTHK